MRWIFQHNPQIRDSWEYSEIQLQWDALQKTGEKHIRYYRDNKLLHDRAVSGGAAPDFATEVHANMIPGYSPLLWGGVYIAWGGFLRIGFRGTIRFSPDGPTYNPWILEKQTWDTTPNLEQRGITYTSNDWAWPLISEATGYRAFAGVPYYYSPSTQPANHETFGWGNHQTYDTTLSGAKPFWYGGANNTWHIAEDSYTGPGTTRTLYSPGTQAVHRPVEGMEARPYIRMRRKVHKHAVSLSEYYEPEANLPLYGNAFAYNYWQQVFLAENEPSTEEGAPNTLWQEHWFSDTTTRRAIHWWQKPLGNAKYGYSWDEWEIDCNFMTKEKINILVKYDPLVDKGAENMFFEIAVL